MLISRSDHRSFHHSLYLVLFSFPPVTLVPTCQAFFTPFRTFSSAHPPPLNLGLIALRTPLQPLRRTHDPRSLPYGRSPRSHDLRHHVFDVPTDLPAHMLEADDVAGTDGVVWVGDEVGFVGAESLDLNLISFFPP